MPEIKKVRLKSEKRFTRENDEDFDLLCKCIYSVFGLDRNEDMFIDAATGIGIDCKDYIELVKLLFEKKSRDKKEK
jgi:hypothetical protein